MRFGSVFESVSRYFRASRMRRFVETYGITADTRVLDIGGTPCNWELTPIRPRLTLLNLPRASEVAPPDVVWVSADGCALPFGDHSFDVVFSNSVIEHVGSTERQQQFATEVGRVGRRYCIQTPNRWFPVETHLLTPFVHFLPRAWQAYIVRRWTVWAMLTGIKGERRRFYLEHYLNDIQLLSHAQMRALFPDAAIVRERVLGFTKSLIAERRAHCASLESVR